MDAVVGMRVGTSEAFLDQNGQAEFVRFFDGVVKGVVGFDSPVHLGPIENVLCPGRAEWGIVEQADAMFEDHPR